MQGEGWVTEPHCALGLQSDTMNAIHGQVYFQTLVFFLHTGVAMEEGQERDSSSDEQEFIMNQ